MTKFKRRLIAAMSAAALTAGICSVVFFEAVPAISKVAVMAPGVPFAFVMAVLAPAQHGPHTPGSGEAALGMMLIVGAAISWFLIFLTGCYVVLSCLSRREAEPRERRQ